MVTPTFVLKPSSPKYNSVLLIDGSNTVGRNRDTGIANLSVSREHFKVLVESNSCKIKCIHQNSYCVLKVDACPVSQEWIDCPEGAKVELRTSTDVSYKYTLERYKPTTSSTSMTNTQGKQDPSSMDRCASINLGKRNEKFCESFCCPVCHEVLFQPTELECPGRHLFCRECIPGLLPAKRCPVCREDIGGRHSKKPKLKPQAVGLVEETVKWMVESRMFDYGDETQWRERANLPPLSPPSHEVDSQASSNDAGPGENSGVGTHDHIRKRPNQTASSAYSAASEVINLMSDSDDD